MCAKHPSFLAMFLLRKNNVHIYCAKHIADKMRRIICIYSAHKMRKLFCAIYTQIMLRKKNIAKKEGYSCAQNIAN